MIKIALLINKLGYFYRGGVNSFVRHFQDVVNNCSDDSLHCDLFAMSKTGISNNRLDRDIALFDKAVIKNYDVLFLADFHLYGEDDLTILEQFAKTNKRIVSYVHGPDSIIPSNYGFIEEYVDHIFWDRELLMKDTISRYGVNKSNSLLTLPYYVFAHDFDNDSIYRMNIIASQCRVAPLKGIERILRASRHIQDRVVVFGYTGDRIKTRDIDYYEVLKKEVQDCKNVTLFMSSYGISSSSVATLLRSCKAYLSATKYEVPGVYGIEYAAMEAMDSGCLPIIDSNIEIEYVNKGAEALFYCSSDEMIEQMTRSIKDYESSSSQALISNNRLFLNNKMSFFIDQLKTVIIGL
jgi:glycosyltransferase involved in cell wall biosynthesis